MEYEVDNIDHDVFDKEHFKLRIQYEIDRRERKKYEIEKRVRFKNRLQIKNSGNNDKVKEG